MNYRVSVLLLAWFSHYFHFCLRSFLYRSTYCYFVFFRYVFDGIRWKLIIFGKVTITLNYIISSKPYLQIWCSIHTKVVGNKAKGRISKRVFQENKGRQIFRKKNSYPLIRTRTCAYQRVRNNRFPDYRVSLCFPEKCHKKIWPELFL